MSTTSQNLRLWSTTAADNDDADDGIPVPEGMNPGALNDGVRAVMATLRAYTWDTDGKLTAGGTADALTVTTQQGTSNAMLADGFRIGVWAAGTNTVAGVTIAVDGLSTKVIKDANGAALAVGAITTGMFLDLVYEGGGGVFHALNINPPTLASLGLGTSDTPQFTGIELGHATDTTLTRLSAGNLGIEGNLIYRAGGTDVPIADGGTGAGTAQGAADNIVGAALTVTTAPDYFITQFSGSARRLTTANAIEKLLAALGTTKGNIIYHNGTAWAALAPP